MTDISTRQHQEQNVKRLKAARYLYSRGKLISTIQILLALVIPVVGAVSVKFWDETLPWVAIVGILVALLNRVCLDPWQRRHRKTAARIQEDFDCRVLELPWDSFLAGKRPGAEDIHEPAKRAEPIAEAPLGNWYSPSVDSLPIHHARVVCQRTNCSWDARQRRRYKRGIGTALALISVVVLSISYGLEMNLQKFVLFVCAPLLPTFLWCIPEARRHGEAADEAVRLRDLTDGLWKRITHEDLSDCEVTRLSRALQNAIYLRRVANPFVWDWVYVKLRGAYEEQMNVEVEDMVARLTTTSESD